MERKKSELNEDEKTFLNSMYKELCNANAYFHLENDKDIADLTLVVTMLEYVIEYKTVKNETLSAENFTFFLIQRYAPKIHFQERKISIEEINRTLTIFDELEVPLKQKIFAYILNSFGKQKQ